MKEYYIWRDKTLHIPWYGSSTEDEVKKDISWKEGETTILGLDIDVSARANGRTNLDFHLNGSLLVHFHWEIWEDMAVKTWRGDAVGKLVNGLNIFEAVYYKDPAHPFDVSSTFTLTAILNYEGKEVTVKPWWERYLIPLAIGSTVVVGGISAIVVAKKKR